MMRPSDFCASNTTKWDRWVIENGLPTVPARMRPGLAVPIARWIDEERCLVLHVMDCIHDQECSSSDVHFVTDLRRFVKRGKEWERLPVSGGGDWLYGDSLRLNIPDARAYFTDDGFGEVRWLGATVGSLEGSSGRHAASVNLYFESETITRAIDAPNGVFVVGFGAVRPHTIEVVGGDGSVLAREILAASY